MKIDNSLQKVPAHSSTLFPSLEKGRTPESKLKKFLFFAVFCRIKQSRGVKYVIPYLNYEERQRRFEEFLKCTVLMAKNEGFSKKCASDLQFFVEITREERDETILSCYFLKDQVNAKFERFDFTKRITEMSRNSNEAFLRMRRLLTKYTKDAGQ